NQSHGLSGSRGALRVWNALMTDADIVPALTDASETVSIDYASGLRAMPQCGGTVSIPGPVDQELPWKRGCAPGG
ncbi:MAG: hypothetical protein OXG44_09735, partial [Gammaproteobacteria bacterium]|nr:hypothetical protein [Gammaproteobacteria bacterium]